MERPRREKFILDVRRSARTVQKSDVEADSDAMDADAITKILHRAALWLTPKVVEHYRPKDFTDWPREQQARLELAVQEFRNRTRKVPQNEPLTVDQFMERTRCFRELVNVLGEMVRLEWMQAIATIEKEAEQWSAEIGWRTRRVNKRMSESLIGTYESEQLLIFAEPNLYVLDPVARFIPGGQGSFDLAIQPSYYTTSLYRDDGGKWFVHLEVRNGVSKGRRVEWTKDAFRQCIEQLTVFV